MDRSRLRKRKRLNYCQLDESPLDKYIYCESCYDFVYEYCAIHGSLLIIPDNEVTYKAGVPRWVPRAALTIPTAFLHIAQSCIPGAGLGVFSSVTLPRGVRFGPFLGKPADDVNSMYCWQINTEDNHTFIDGENEEFSNWMRYVNCSRHWGEQNLVAYQFQGQMYYRTVKTIPKFTELLVFYGSRFANALGIKLKDYNNLQKFIADEYITENRDPYQVENNLSEPIFNTELLEICEETTTKNINIEQENKLKLAVENEQQKQINFEIFNDESNVYKRRKKIMCEVCHKIVQFRNFKRHKLTHAKEDFFCSQCNYKTNFKSFVERHLKKHPNGKTSYECDRCTYLTNNQIYFRRHYKVVHKKVLTVHYNLNKFIIVEGETFDFNCTKCFFKTNVEVNFVEHLETHKNEMYRCDLCDYHSNKRKNFLSHIRIHSKK